MYASGVSERRKLKTQTRTEAVNYTAAHFALIITHYLFTARKKRPVNVNISAKASLKIKGKFTFCCKIAAVFQINNEKKPGTAKVPGLCIVMHLTDYSGLVLVDLILVQILLISLVIFGGMGLTMNILERSSSGRKILGFSLVSLSTRGFDAGTALK